MIITVRSCAHQNTKSFGPTFRAVLRDGGPQIRTEPSTSRWGAGGFRRAWRLLAPVTAGHRPLRAGGASEGSASLLDGAEGSRLLEIRGGCSAADGPHVPTVSRCGFDGEQEGHLVTRIGTV